MLDFKAFLDAVASGHDRSDLFLVANKYLRDLAIVDLFNEAGERHLRPIVRHASGVVLVGDHSHAYLCIAHPKIGIQHSGRAYTQIHGLETLDEYPQHAEEDKARLRACIRR